LQAMDVWMRPHFTIRGMALPPMATRQSSHSETGEWKCVTRRTRQIDHELPVCEFSALQSE
jgi:hypothetical protein